MKDLLNSISVISTFLTGVAIIYLILDFTVGRIEKVKSYTLYKTIHLKDIVFISISVGLLLVLLLSKIITFYLPW